MGLIVLISFKFISLLILHYLLFHLHFKDVCRTKINGENKPMTLPCIFPFTYENVTYTKCVGNFLFPRLEGEQGICPVVVMGGDPFGNWYENKTQWGYCELKPRGMCEKTEGIYDINFL